MRRLFALTLAMLMLIAAKADASLINISLSQPGVSPPLEKFYVSDTLYEDPSLIVRLEYGREMNTDYVAAYVKVATAQQIRTAMETDDGRDTALGTRIARHSGAVLAVNGDFFRFHMPGVGRYIVRQGRVLMRTAEGVFDTLIIDSSGNFHVILNATAQDIKDFPGLIVNCFSFGPALIVDGEVRKDIPADSYIYSDHPNQRVAICQLGPLEYLAVACAGPENPHNTGLTLDQFAQLISQLGDVQVAYNLDGGISSSLIFHNQKANTFVEGMTRQISDMIVFVSAWGE